LNFEDILPALKQGKKIRRKDWEEGIYYVYRDPELRQGIDSNEDSEFEILDIESDEIFMEDWEVLA
jgi:hypothetical protein